MFASVLIGSLRYLHPFSLVRVKNFFLVFIQLKTVLTLIVVDHKILNHNRYKSQFEATKHVEIFEGLQG